MNSKTAIRIMLLLLSAVTIFHFSIILKFIPYEITWGGRLKNDAEMYVFESISIMINAFLILTLLIRGNYIRQIFSVKAVTVILWVFLVIFGLNTIGNLFANTDFEKSLAVLTLASAILVGIILKAGNNEHTSRYKRY